MGWTPEQSEAIEDRGNTLLVAAAAGSGKTAVLVERIAGLVLSDRVEVDRLLVMTFTRAAAAEMKERIAARLEAALSEGEDREYIIRQQDRLQGAQISTMHAFCSLLVRRYFSRLSLDPGFRMLDADEEELLRESVLDTVLEEFYEEGEPWFSRLVRTLGSTRGDAPFRETILLLDSFLRGCGDPEGWLSEHLEAFRQEARDYAGSAVAQEICREAETALTGARELARENMELAEASTVFYWEGAREDQALVESLLVAAGRGYLELAPVLMEAGFSRLKPKPRNWEGDPADAELFRENREEIKKAVEDLKRLVPAPVEDLQEMSRRVHQDLLDIREVLNRFREELDRAKKEAGALAFDDLEHYTLRLLEDETIRQEVREQYLYVFVDEYQDTSLVQEEIIRRVSREDSLFMVGDVKQSIYRFRQAAPEVFLARKDRLVEGRDPGPSRLIALNRNFRSAEPIVDTVNHLFSRLMSRELGEIDYDTVERLNYGALLPGEEHPVQMVLLDKEESWETEDGQPDPGYVEREAAVAATLLKEAHGRPIFDHKTGSRRPLAWKDMVVILRTKAGWGDRYLEVLRRQGIPVFMDQSPGYFDALEVEVLVNMLRLTDNPRQDYPWLSFLRCPSIGMSGEQLGEMRAMNPEGSFFEAVESAPAESPAGQAREMVNRWRSYSSYMTLDHLVQRILRESGWMALAGAMENGPQRQANLRLFLSRAKKYAGQSVRGLSGFLFWLDRLKQRQSDPGVAALAGENADVVRIISAHRSKGLEYPLVLVGALGKEFNDSDSREPLLLHRFRGLGPRYTDPERRIAVPMPDRTLIASRLKRETRSEEMRILYVAATRARNRLILLGGIPGSREETMKKTQIRDAVRGRSWAQWLLPVLEESCPDCLQLIRWDRSRQVLEEEKRALETGLIRAGLEREISRPPAGECESGKLPQYAGKIPAKLAVTDVFRYRNRSLSELERLRVERVDKPRFLLGEEASGTERGLSYHHVMQWLDTDRCGSEEEIAAQIGRMVEREMLLPEEAALVDPGAIRKFFEGELGQRLLSSSQVRREVPFNLQVPAERVFPEATGSGEMVLIQGVMDLYFREPEGWVLLDYKTDRRVRPDSGQLEAYRQQLGLYREALETMTGVPVIRTCLYLFSAGVAVDLEV